MKRGPGVKKREARSNRVGCSRMGWELTFLPDIRHPSPVTPAAGVR